MNPFISVIIPAYNEEARIKRSLEQAVEFITNHHYSFELIVVDDGSSDNTREMVLSYDSNVKLIPLSKNMGKGAAVRTGMLAASGEYRIFTDADFSTPVYEIEKLIHSLQSGNDICIGSRTLNPSMIKEHQPFYREFMGKSFNKIVKLLLFSGINDTQCGFKGFTAGTAEKIFSKAKIDGFSFDVEILYLAKREGLKIDQVAVEWYNDERSRVDPVKDSIRMLIELFKIRGLHKNDR